MWLLLEHKKELNPSCLETQRGNSESSTKFCILNDLDWLQFVLQMRAKHKARLGATTRLWASPKATCIFESVQHWAIRRKKPSAKNMGAPLTVAVLIEIENSDQHKQLQLHPRWVECLMGLPIGWTNPNASSIYVG